MDFLKSIEICGTVLTLIGIPLISWEPRRLGMWFLSIATIFWIVFSCLNNYYYLLLQSIYILFFDVYALWSWKKKGIKF